MASCASREELTRARKSLLLDVLTDATFCLYDVLKVRKFAVQKQVLPRVVSPRQALSDTPDSAYQGKGSWSPSEGQPRSRTRLLAHALGGRQLPTSSSC